MRKLWLCLFYALCVFTIVFSLFWMALPRLPLGRADSAEETPVPSLPSISVLHHLLPLRRGRAGRGLAV